MSAPTRPGTEPDTEYAIENGWLIEVTGEHTCGTGPDGHYGVHEPGCGTTPLISIEELNKRMSALGRVSFAVLPQDTGGGHHHVRIFAGKPGETRAFLGALTCSADEAQALVDLFGTDDQ